MRASPSRDWFGFNKQKGQALIYGLFVLTCGLAALFFLFNTGQLSREKTKLVNTADAVAYSAGVMHARALNFAAYTNRAMVANTVAIAQLVSISSWVQYTNNLSMYGFTAGNPVKYPGFYASYLAAAELGPYLQTSLVDEGMLEDLASASDLIIQALMGTQAAINAGLIATRQQVMNDVASANYQNDGTVIAEALQPLPDSYTQFVSQYTDNDRARFAEVAKTSAYKDGFLPKRSWAMPGLYSDCAGILKQDWLDRRGGTELVSYDEWAAMDTLSEKRWKKMNKFDITCSALGEAPVSWGRQVASDNETLDIGPTHYDYSMMINPSSSALAIATSSSAWGYKGLPKFYDLSSDVQKQADPRLRFAIRLRRNKSQTATSDGRSAIHSTPTLNAYEAQPAGGDELVAVSISEVFFEREADAKNNVYGQSIGKPNEIGSLFNPYWQVHLIQSDSDIKAAQVLQGAVLP